MSYLVLGGGRKNAGRLGETCCDGCAEGNGCGSKSTGLLVLAALLGVVLFWKS